MPPENKGVGWRKKIQNKPKELQPHKVSADDAVASGRHLFSRKGIQSSRPATPATSTIEEADEGPGEPAQSTTPRRSSKPKLVRYTSLFTSFKDVSEPKSPDFAEPWGDIDPNSAAPVPYVDPIAIIQAIRSHMANFSTTPLSSTHNSGLFRVFEHYYKLRSENERLEVGLHEARQELQSTQDRWTDEERRYAEEIRRLELLIAQGTAGVAGFLHARHGSVIDRKRMHRKTISGDLKSTWNGFLTQEQINTEIRSRSQDVILQRSTSPSGKMAALSRHFTTRAGSDLQVGTPPTDDRSPMLSRKVRSELDLSKLANRNVVQSFANSSLNSGFSGDPLPDELSPPSPVPVELTAESDAFVALRELGTLVARRRGLDADTFVNKLMTLFSDTEKVEGDTKAVQQSKPVDDHGRSQKPCIGETTPIRTLRRFQSQPQLGSDIKRRRHFSFEPGEDHLHALQEESTPNASAKSQKTPSIPGSPASDILLRSEGLDSPYQVPTPDPQNLSKIPTPVHPFGSLRREASVSSLQSKQATSSDGRHTSQSSILTAFRENQNGAKRPSSSSRSSSINNLRGTDASPSSTEQPGNVRVRNSVVSLVTTRAGDPTNRSVTSQDGSPARSKPRTSTTGLSSRATRHMGPVEPENNDPKRGVGA
ncbi:hypothetical protein CC86DRAFT_349335 [Ophiobolus disseminans]|uniref:Uncharacterized protein n=1 Tax=Ophiobolus disseminans TaxID=1469910 RepID=A0A6A7A504_9PLEO|nr:hypothetical protein CC86DRAFT_349335 [Ophiobolus disseminans]